MAGLQENALSLGADGIANVEMNTQVATAFLDECWKQITASGVAYKLVPWIPGQRNWLSLLPRRL